MKQLTKTKILCSMLIGAGLIASVGAFAMNNVSTSSATAATADTFAMERGAGVRLAEPYGIRFKAKIGENVYNDIMNPAANETKKVGMFIVPAAYVNDADAYTDSTVGNYQNFKQKTDLVFYDSTNAEAGTKIYDDGDGYYYANGVIANLKFQNYGLEFIGIAYVATTVSDTTTYEFADFNLDETARTSTYVASAAYDDYAAYRDVLTDYVYGAYLYSQGATYDEALDVYNVDNMQYDTIDEAIAELNCSFTLNLSDATANMLAMEEKTLTATYKNGDTDTGLDLAFKWTSDDESVVKVENGKLFATGAGEATVSVSVLGQTQNCTVSVTDERQVQTLDAVDYDLSVGGNLAITGLSGTAQTAYVTAVKGDESVELPATLNGDTVTVAETDVKALSTGVWTFTVNTSATTATVEVTVATYVIGNQAALETFYATLPDDQYETTTKDWYVVLSDTFTVTNYEWAGKYSVFSGVLDGRGHIIDGLKVNRWFLGFLHGTVKNIGFTNYEQLSYGNDKSSYFVNKSNTGGTISNVYISGKVVLGGALMYQKTMTAENVMLNITYTSTAKTPAYVVCETVGATHDASKIYAIANTEVAEGEVFFNMDSTDQTGVYASADALVDAKNANGDMFSSANGWSDVWELKADGIYFGGVRVETRTAKKLGVGAYDYDLSVGGALTVENLPTNATQAFITKGTQTVDLTNKVSGTTLTVDETAMQGLATGVWSLTVMTASDAYTAEVTVATYVISDGAEWNTFNSVLSETATDTSSSDWLVVLDKNFDATQTWGRGLYKVFSGVLDGRGHIINNLEVNRCLLGFLNGGTIKNIGFTNYHQSDITSDSNVNIYFVKNTKSVGTISNVYMQAKDSFNASFIGSTNIAVNNVVLDVTHTTGTKITSYTEAYTLYNGSTSKYTTDDIYVIATTTVDGATVSFSKDYTTDGNGVYASADALVDAKNANGDMFSSANGWSDVWELKADGVYFGGEKVESLS